MITVIVTKPEAWEVAQHSNAESKITAKSITKEARRIIDALSPNDRTRIVFSKVEIKFFATLYATHDSRDIRIMELKPMIVKHWAQEKGIYPKDNATPYKDPRAWSEEEERLLIDMIHSGKRWPEIVPKFPTRSEAAIHNRAAALKEQGRLKWYPQAQSIFTAHMSHKMCGNCKSFKVDTKRTKTDRFLCKVLMGTCSKTGERRDRCDWCNTKGRKHEPPVLPPPTAD